MEPNAAPDEAAHEGGRLQRERDRHHRAPGVSKHDGLLDSKLVQGMLVERGMGAGRPQVPWSLAVAVTGSLDDNDPVALGQAIHESVYGEVLDQGAVAANEHQGLTCPP